MLACDDLVDRDAAGESVVSDGVGSGCAFLPVGADVGGVVDAVGDALAPGDGVGWLGVVQPSCALEDGDLHQVLGVGLDGGKFVAGPADVAVVVAPLRFVLEGAQRLVPDQDVAVVVKPLPLEQDVGDKGEGAVLDEVGQGVPGEGRADEHGGMVAGESDSRAPKFGQMVESSLWC